MILESLESAEFVGPSEAELEEKNVFLPDGSILTVAREVGTEDWMWYDKNSGKLRNAGDGTMRAVRDSIIAMHNENKKHK